MGAGDARRPTSELRAGSNEWVADATQAMGWITDERGLGAKLRALSFEGCSPHESQTDRAHIWYEMNEQARDSKKLVIEISAAVHFVLSVFCAVCAVTTPSWIVRFVWALGPAANLVHGTTFLVPFLVGTVLVTLLLLVTVFARPSLVRAFAAIFLLLVWLAFGILAYAPGA